MKVMTYNIHGAIGIDGKHSVERIAEVVRNSGARIACLQEVHTFRAVSGNADHPAELGKLLGMRAMFQRNYRKDAGGLGNLILTDLDVLQSRSHILTSKGEQRGVIEVVVQTETGPLTVFCTHFGLDDDERLGQAKELAGLLNAVKTPRIACGDFNAEAKEKPMRELIRSAGMIDSAAGGPATFDAVNPEVRIDFILHDPSITAQNVSVLRTQASDHLPLVADLKLPG